MRHLSKMNRLSASAVQLLAFVAAFLCVASAQDAHAASSSAARMEIPSIMAPAVGALQAPGRSLLRNPPTYVAGTPFSVVATGKCAQPTHLPLPKLRVAVFKYLATRWIQ
jgi:hypothetical protein